MTERSLPTPENGFDLKILQTQIQDLKALRNDLVKKYGEKMADDMVKNPGIAQKLVDILTGVARTIPGVGNSFIDSRLMRESVSIENHLMTATGGLVKKNGDLVNIRVYYSDADNGNYVVDLNREGIDESSRIQLIFKENKFVKGFDGSEKTCDNESIDCLRHEVEKIFR